MRIADASSARTTCAARGLTRAVFELGVEPRLGGVRHLHTAFDVRALAREDAACEVDALARCGGGIDAGVRPVGDLNPEVGDPEPGGLVTADRRAGVVLNVDRHPDLVSARHGVPCPDRQDIHWRRGRRDRRCIRRGVGRRIRRRIRRWRSALGGAGNQKSRSQRRGDDSDSHALPFAIHLSMPARKLSMPARKRPRRLALATYSSDTPVSNSGCCESFPLPPRNQKCLS